MGINQRTLSAAAFERAQQVIPGGVNSPVRALRSVGTTPLFIERANRAYLTDIDGNTFIDFCMSWGVFILGHNNPAVSRRVMEAIQRGSSYGIPTEAETLLAERVREAFPSMQRLRFVNSGTEATMSAIRVARGFTGRDTLVKFEGNYHGHADHLLVSAGSAVANISTASSAGVPQDFTKHTVCLPYSDVEALEQYFREHGEQVAAVILEPVACNMGVVVPSLDFMQATRRLTTQYGAVLIFDEVITGFRLALGGAQEYYGVRADLCTFGKIIGGGMPVGAYGGRREILSMVAPLGSVYQAGTLSGNPVAMAAGLAQLRLLKETPDFYGNLNGKADAFFSALGKVLADSGRGFCLNHVGSLGCVFFTDGPVTNYEEAQASDTGRFTEYFRRMLDRGVYLAPSQFEAMFLSDAHSKEDLERTLAAAGEALK